MSALQQALFMAAAAGGGGGTDPDFAFVTVLAHFNGTNGSTTFVNSASSGIAITAGAGTQLTTSSPLAGSASMDCAAGRCFATDDVLNQIGTGDFCFDFDFFTASPTQVKNLCDWNGGAFFIYTQSSQYHFYVGGIDRIVGGTVGTNTRDRLRLNRVSGVTRLWQAGSQIGSNYTDSNSYAHGPVYLGGDGGSSANSTGKYDEWRVTVGHGRGTSSYTPDVGEFPNS